MRSSLSMRAAAASAAVALFLSPGLDAALAHGRASFRVPMMRPAFAAGHAQAQGGRNGGRQSWTWQGQNRRSRWVWYWGGFGSGYPFSPYGYADTSSEFGGGAQIIVVGAPSFNDFPAAVDESANFSAEGGCVIHKLGYDSAGKYVGERQIPGC
jgi:hypothetical protein